MMETEKLSLAYTNYSEYINSRIKSQTLLPIDSLMENIAALLSLNNYEISEWEYKYLCVWSECNEYPYITSTKLCMYLDVSDIDVIKFYFDIYDRHVEYNNFLSFICIFAFFPIESLIQILLSICSINSHYMIQKDQIITFLRCIGVESSELDPILEWYKKTVVGKSRQIELRIFLTYLERHNELLGNILNLRKSIISNVITNSTYNKIKNRMEFFDKKNYSSYPPESCISYLNRTCITHEPHPYYSDYKTNNNSSRVSYLTVTFEIKKRYGYAKRIERNSKASSGNNQRSAPDSTSEKYEEGQNRIKSSLKPSKSSVSANMFSPVNSHRSVSTYKLQSRRGTLLTGDRSSSKVYPGPSFMSPTNKTNSGIVV